MNSRSRARTRPRRRRKPAAFKDEIVPVMIPQRKGDPVAFAADEFIKAGTTLESIAGLRPAFAKDGSVTAANASGLNDGAAAVAGDERGARGASSASSRSRRSRRSRRPASIRRSWAWGPVPASKRCLERPAGSASDLDLMEINEAFAAQACAVNKEMGWDTSKINVNGGAIALGHPIGASGAACWSRCCTRCARRDAKKGLASLCIGGGMGVAHRGGTVSPSVRDRLPARSAVVKRVRIESLH